MSAGSADPGAAGARLGQGKQHLPQSAMNACGLFTFRLLMSWQQKRCVRSLTRAQFTFTQLRFFAPFSSAVERGLRAATRGIRVAETLKADVV